MLVWFSIASVLTLDSQETIVTEPIRKTLKAKFKELSSISKVSLVKLGFLL